MSAIDLKTLESKTKKYFGLTQPFSKRQLLDIYKKAALKYHPDKNSDTNDFADMNNTKIVILELFSLHKCNENDAINVFNTELERELKTNFYKKLCDMKEILEKIYKLQQPFSCVEFLKRHDVLVQRYADDNNMALLNRYRNEVLILFGNFNVQPDERVMLFEPSYILKKIHGEFYGRLLWYSILTISHILSIPGIVIIGSIVYYYCRYT